MLIDSENTREFGVWFVLYIGLFECSNFIIFR